METAEGWEPERRDAEIQVADVGLGQGREEFGGGAVGREPPD